MLTHNLDRIANTTLISVIKHENYIRNIDHFFAKVI